MASTVLAQQWSESIAAIRAAMEGVGKNDGFQVHGVAAVCGGGMS